MSLTVLVNRLREGRFVIPDFQREFEWKPWDISELMRSIFLDYFIGSLLLWKGKKRILIPWPAKQSMAFKVRELLSMLPEDPEEPETLFEIESELDSEGVDDGVEAVSEGAEV